MRQWIAFLVCFACVLASPPPSWSESEPEDMVWIPAGCFMMGTDRVYYYDSLDENIRERPLHEVCVDGFYLEKTEVPQYKWDEVMQYNNATFQAPELPITGITWKEALDYCTRIGRRLPTEAEWEYAARAGSQTENPWGDGIDREHLWYLGNSRRKLSPVGMKKPNAFGLHDMMGSVWEWVEDWYSENFYQVSPKMNPKGPERGSFHVIRGASWVDDEDAIRVMVRHPGMADHSQDYWVGVRCAWTPGKKASPEEADDKKAGSTDSEKAKKQTPKDSKKEN